MGKDTFWPAFHQKGFLGVGRPDFGGWRTRRDEFGKKRVPSRPQVEVHVQLPGASGHLLAVTLEDCGQEPSVSGYDPDPAKAPLLVGHMARSRGQRRRKTFRQGAS